MLKVDSRSQPSHSRALAMQQFLNDLFEVHFAVGADASTLYSILSTVAQTLSATTGFAIAFALLRFPAIESQLASIDNVLRATRVWMPKELAWTYLLRNDGAKALRSALERAAGGAHKVNAPTLEELEIAHDTALPLLAHWHVTRTLFEWTLGINFMVILFALALMPYVPWLAKAQDRVTGTCAFAVLGGVVGVALSFGFARVLVRTKRITPHDPPTA